MATVVRSKRAWRGSGGTLLLRHQTALRPGGHRRLAAVGLVAVALGAHLLPASVGLPCPLRSLTGVPCPFCGTQTSLRFIAQGHLGNAWSAAPLGFVVLVAALASLAMPRDEIEVKVPTVALLVLVGAEWVFELARFHLLG